MAPPGALERLLDPTCRGLQRALRDQVATVSVREIGRVDFVGAGIARLRGLPGVRSQELVRLHDDVLAMALDLEARDVGVVLLDPGESLTAGSEARRTGRVLDVPVGESLLGRIVTPLGSPLDGGSPIRGIERRPAEREAPAIIQRAPVSVPLQTGLKAVDALVPIGRGQRELILGDRQTGKTAIAADAIINQRSTGVICVYCAIGQRRSAIARLIEQLRARGAWQHTIVVAAEGGTPPGLQFVAPYAATTMAEYFVERGHDVLIVYDDLTRHAVAYRELSLLLRRPPGREAFPGDIFYVHSRLLERSTRYRDADGGGSLTALPIAETEAQNIAGYIPTNLISITDGQIYLSPELFRKGVLPAVDIGRSVSRVGGKAQLAAFRTVAAQLRLAYAQFEELESFARFGTRLDDAARQAIARGQRVREVLKQPQLEPLSAATQIAVLLAVGEGLLDASLLTDIAAIEGRIHAAVAEDEGGHFGRLQAGGDLTAETRRRVNTVLRHAIEGPRDDGQPR